MGKIAIVTGASSGIGYEIAKQLTQKNWKVLGVAIDASSENVFQGVVPLKVDLLKNGVQKEIIKVADEKFGSLDLLVNNAGCSWVGNFEDMASTNIDRILDLNVRSLMLMAQEAIALLTKSQSGQIINIGSVAAHVPMEKIAVYCASKAAVVMFSKVLAKELVPKGIRVNVLSPTGTDTKMFETVGVDIDKTCLVSSEDMAEMAIALTELPKSLDVSEIITHKRFQP